MYYVDLTNILLSLHIGTTLDEEESPASSKDISKVDGVLTSLRDAHGDINAADCQGIYSCILVDLCFYLCMVCAGTAHFLSVNPAIQEPIDLGDEDDANRTDCIKETGEKKQLRKWTRGVWMCVSGSGLIQTWQPLYK